MYEHFWKRLIDIVLSTIGIIVMAIPMLIVALIIKIDSPGPVFFKQKRIGIHKKTFMIIKFRSMPVSIPKDIPTHQFEGGSLLSAWQRFMRKSSIDELPQLFCIWISHMSIVGPRPALWNQDDLVAERDKYGANDIKPGLTGWAQIHGRKDVEWHKRIKMNIWYVDHVSFVLDLKIFFITVLKVFAGSDNENTTETVTDKKS